MFNDKEISDGDLGKIVMFIRHSMFLPENKKLAELRTMILSSLKPKDNTVDSSHAMPLGKLQPKWDRSEILKLLDDIDGFAADSRGCYENARGNDSCCYAATKKIRDILAGKKENDNA